MPFNGSRCHSRWTSGLRRALIDQIINRIEDDHEYSQDIWMKLMTLHHQIIKYNRIIDIQIKDASSGPKVETKLNYYHVIMSHKRYEFYKTKVDHLSYRICYRCDSVIFS